MKKMKQRTSDSKLARRITSLEKFTRPPYLTKMANLMIKNMTAPSEWRLIHYMYCTMDSPLIHVTRPFYRL